MIKYEVYTTSISQMKLGDGFFEGWPNPPSKEMHRVILEQAYKSLVAVDEERQEIIGFIHAISDGILSAYIPLLEVLPQYRNKGIGTELVKRMLQELDSLYMIDLCCDEDLVAFYEELGLRKSQAMIGRNYQNQSGRG